MAFGRVNPPGLVYKIDLSKIADRENPRTVEAPIYVSGSYPEPVIIDWGDGSSEVISSGAWPTHTYAADGVYTVTLRTATGHLPRLVFATDSATVEKNLTLAVTAIDHFGGTVTYPSNSDADRRQTALCRNTANLNYADPRIAAVPEVSGLLGAFAASGIAQPLDGFCFDFMTMVADIRNLFSNAVNAYGKAPRLPEHATNILSAFAFTQITDFEPLPSNVQVIGSVFRATQITRFPEIPTTLTNCSYCFEGCEALNVSTKSAPELWDNTVYPGVTSYMRTFRGLTNLANYADIPADWK